MAIVILQHHQAIDKKIHNIERLIIEPLTDLVTPIENLVKVLKKNSDPKDIQVKEELVNNIRSLIKEADMLNEVYLQAVAELEKIEQAGEHEDVNIEKEPEEQFKQKLASLIENGPWAQGKFFEGIKHSLAAVSDNYDELLGLKSKKDERSMAELAGEHLGITPKEDTIEIFVSLHNSQGGSENAIATWENLLTTIGKQTINRPIYGTEHDVQAFVRSSKDPSKEAYVCALVTKKDLMAPPGGVELKDREDRPLLVVKERSVSTTNIKYFVHISGKYEYQNNKLIRIDNPEDDKMSMGIGHNK